MELRCECGGEVKNVKILLGGGGLLPGRCVACKKTVTSTAKEVPLTELIKNKLHGRKVTYDRKGNREVREKRPSTEAGVSYTVADLEEIEKLETACYGTIRCEKTRAVHRAATVVDETYHDRATRCGRTLPSRSVSSIDGDVTCKSCLRLMKKSL